jgi:hypothetical protein
LLIRPMEGIPIEDVYSKVNGCGKEVTLHTEPVCKSLLANPHDFCCKKVSLIMKFHSAVIRKQITHRRIYWRIVYLVKKNPTKQNKKNPSRDWVKYSIM